MAESTEPIVQTCASCGALIDVTDEEPFALMHCPNCGTGMRVRRSFDHFELQEPLGSGGMGSVYRALDTTLNRMVALKLLRKEYSADPVFVEQFQREAAVTASINHPYVVKVYSTGEDHGLIYITMELVDKGSLDDLMGLQGRVPEAQVLGVGIQIAKGLEAALQRGLIHRDIKPGNILFADAHTAKIVDFGLAVLMEHAGKIGGDVWGTPYYVAPEKLDHQPEDHRSDIYSLGGSLFHALAGRPPFEAETASMVALKHVKSQAVSLQAFAPDVSSATAFVINKTLFKNPDERYQTYADLIEHLEYARSELLEKVGSAGKKSRVVLEGENEQKAMTWITFAVVAIIVIGGVLGFFFRDRFMPRPAGGDAAMEQAHESASALEPRYRAARELVLGDKPQEGAEALRKLDNEPKIPQPLHNWITVYAGLAELLASREKEARQMFAKLEARGAYSTDPGEKKLTDFFLELARRLTRDASIPASVAKEYDKATHEALALVLFALKDWELGSYEEAGPLFRQFQSASPQLPKTWLGDAEEIAALKKIAGKYVNDFVMWREVTDAIKSANTLADRQAALKKARAARDALETKGQLKLFFDSTISELAKDVVTRGEEEIRKMAEQETADAQALAEAKTKAAPLAKQLKFNEAYAALSAARVGSEKAKREWDMLVKKYEWLARFKATLIKDLNTAGFPNPVARKSGGSLSGGVNKADETQVYNRTPYGSLPVLWTDLVPESIYGMAASFIRPGTPPELVAERKWLLGVYTCFIGRAREGRALLAEAAQVKKEYGEVLQPFLEVAENP
jgi:predicted RNA-binding Zn-ribbon protein involved in translation (DUF1610 family)